MFDMIALRDRLASPTVQQRIAMQQAEVLDRLAREGRRLTTERDPLGAGWLVRDPRRSGFLEIVTEHGRCSCQQYRFFDRCPHSAIVALRHGLAH